MKKLISVIITIAIFLSSLAGITVSAAEVVTVVADEGWTNATYDAETGILTNVTDGYSFKWTPSTGVIEFGGTIIEAEKVVIPSAVDGVKVIKIGSYVLSGSRTATSLTKEVIVSSGITELGTGAFQQEKSLSSLNLPVGLKTIGSSAINSCTALKTLVIPSSVETIGNNGIASCTVLEAIELPTNLTSLGSQAFSNCKKLSSVVFKGNKLTKLESKTFNLCPLKSITIPDSITNFGSGVFTSCSFTEIVIPAGVTEIPSQLFASCKNLKTITIKGSVNTIGEKAFYNLKALETLNFEGEVAPTSIDQTAFESASTGFTVIYPSRATGYNATFRAFFDGLDVVFSTISGHPEATGVSVKGDPMLGNTLTGYYTGYYDVNGDMEDGSTCSWKRVKNPTVAEDAETIITYPIKSGDTSSYTLTNDDIGYFIIFSVTPRNNAEFDNEGIEVSAATEFIVREPKTIPTTELVSPANGAAIGVTEVTPLLVNVSCDLTTITKVEYYANNELICTSTEEPYSGEWATHSEGYYEIYARAYNALGEYGDSATNTVSVTESEPLVMSSLFADNMVLQRNKPVNIYGNAEDSEKTITVKFNGQEKSCRIEGGKFKVLLDPMTAGGPYTLEVIAGRSGYVKKFENVMVGEVWVCSGQSNMAVNGGSKASGNYPDIRFFKQSSSSASYEMDDVKDGTWNICDPAFSSRYSAVSFYFSEKLHKDMNVPVGILLAAISDTRMVKWMPREALMADGDTALYASKQSGDSQHYNGMVAPLTDFTVGGVLWYQGEGDHLYGSTYEKSLRNLIKYWRQAWGENELPFIIVQIPNFDYSDSTTIEYVREGQLNAFKNLSNIGIVVTIDIGSNTNIHPGNKDILATRAALFAEKLIGFTDESTLCCSPIYQSYEINDNKIIITFDYVGSGLKTTDGEAPSAFTIAGKDGVFVNAQASIIAPNQIEVWAEEISNPVAVRYAWLDIPVVNLVNSGDLPASPFKTDKFKELDNVAPVVELTSPSVNDTYAEGSDITLTAYSYDPDGSVASVNFYANDVLIGTDTTAPYSYTWKSVPAGIYAFTVIATDESGASSDKNGNNVQTKQPFETVVGYTKYQPVNYVEDNFEEYLYNDDGNIAPKSLEGKVTLNGGQVFASKSPQSASGNSMMLTTNTAAQAPVITDTTTNCQGNFFRLKTKVFFDSYAADRTFSLGVNSSANNKEILKFASDGTVSITQPYIKVVDTYDLNKWYDIEITVNTITNRLSIMVNNKKYVDNKIVKGYDSIAGLKIEHLSTSDEAASTYLETLHYGIYNALIAEELIIEEFTYTDADNNKLNSIGNSNKVNVNTRIYNNSSIDTDALFIFGSYSGNKLISIDVTEPVTINAKEPMPFCSSLGISSTDNITTVKAFLFNNKDDLVPLVVFDSLEK